MTTIPPSKFYGTKSPEDHSESDRTQPTPSDVCDSLPDTTCQRHSGGRAHKWRPFNELPFRPWTAPLSEIEHFCCLHHSSTTVFFSNATNNRLTLQVNDAVSYVEVGGGIRIARVRHIFTAPGKEFSLLRLTFRAEDSLQ